MKYQPEDTGELTYINSKLLHLVAGAMFGAAGVIVYAAIFGGLHWMVACP